MLLSILAALLVSAYAVPTKIDDDGASSAPWHFKNVMIEFDGPKGEALGQADETNVPGIVKLLGGSVSFNTGARALDDTWSLKLALEYDFFGYHNLCDLPGISEVCTQKLCSILENKALFGPGACHVLSSGNSVSVTEIGNTVIKIPCINNAIVKAVLKNNWKLRATILDPKGQVMGALGIDKIPLKVIPLSC